MKKILVIVLAVVLALSLSLTGATFAAGGKNEVALAQKSGQAWLDSTVEPLEWIGARLTTPQVCYDLKGKTNAYMFTIENSGQVVGHIIVGSSAYGYPVFEAADCPPPSIPSADEVKSTLQRDLGLKVEEISNPSRLLYLGFDHLFAVYEAGGQEVTVNLVFDFAMSAANLKAAMPSPEEYKARKKATGEAISELLENSDYSSLSLPESGYYRLTMSYYSTPGRRWCGPCSGVSIGRYYRDHKWPGYGDLPDNVDMYDYLYDSMEADKHGGVVYSWDYGPGFLDMTSHYGYNNFEYYGDYWPSHGDYENIVIYINNGWPTALAAAHWDDELTGDPPGDPDWPPPGGHWIAIRGYKFPYSGTVEYSIICTDSYTKSDWLYLDWDHMTIGFPPYSCTIRDYCW